VVLLKRPAYLPAKLLGLAGFAVIVCLLRFWQIPCLIRHLTGLICPSCGLTRAWFSALQLDLAAAFSYHPLFWSVPVFVLYLIFDGRLFRNSKLNHGILFTLIAAFFVCYIIRIIVFLGGGIAV